MIRINLLPVKATRRQEAVKTEMALAGVGLLGLIGVFAALQVMVNNDLAELETEHDRLSKEITRLKTIAGEVDKAEKIKGDLETKLKVIRDLKKSKTGPVYMLDEIAQATPDRLRLTHLEETKGQLQLSGSALSNEVISQFLSNLEQSRRFENVYLSQITQDEKDGVKLKAFELSAQVVTPGESAEPKGEEGGEG